MADLDESPVDVPKSTRKEGVVYCDICSMPPEYCEFGGSVDKCKAWLRAKDVKLYASVWGSQVPDLESSMDNVVIDDNAPPAEPEKAVAAGDKKKEPKKGKKEVKKQIIIKRIERNRRKCVTTVFGLESFEIDLKKAAKLFANKFATGSSVTKNPQGLDEIVVQGDVSDDIFELIISTWQQVTEDDIDL